MLFFIGIIVGITLTLIVQFFILYKWFYSLPKQNNTWKPQTENFSLPKVLNDLLNDPSFKNDKESYFGLNFIFQFLFQELKDTKHVRSWVMKRLKQEFTELLHSTTGKLLDQIRVRNFNLGGTFPVINRASIINVSVNKEDLIEDITLLVDLSYNGDFRLAVDVDMVFGKSAYLSLMLTKLQGSAQLHFSRNPYTHWTFSFVENPFLNFEVESQFEGRPITQLATFITNQIRRAVHRKYTLPNFKIRYSPFFKIYTPERPSKDVYYNNIKLTIGNMNIVVVGCTRLPVTTPDSHLYCSLQLDTMPWMELLSYRKKLWVAKDLEIFKLQQGNIGINFDEVFLWDKLEDVVIVTEVVPGSPANKANIFKGDLIMLLNGTKVTSCKQVTRLIKQSSEKITLRVERSLSKPFIFDGYKEEKRKFENMVQIDDQESLCQNENIILETSPVAARKSLATVFQRKQIKPETIMLESSSKLKFEPEINIATKSESNLSMDSEKSNKFEQEDEIKKCNSNPTLLSDGTSSDHLDKNGIIETRKKTELVKSSQNPAFNETFNFEVENKHNYVNICIWCREPEKQDKQMRVVKGERDILLGHISVPLMDVALECMATLQGDFTHSYNFNPSESKLGTGKAQRSNIANHSGFDEKLSYGNILLRFHYIRPGDQIVDQSKLQTKKSQKELDIDLIQKDPLSYQKTPTGQHKFQPTHFQTPTNCSFCYKKIWFKSAFQCSDCLIFCHKKCLSKCQEKLLCSGKLNKDRAESSSSLLAKKRHNSVPDISQNEKKKDNSKFLRNILERNSSKSIAKLIDSDKNLLMDDNMKLYKLVNDLKEDEISDEHIAAKTTGRQLYLDLNIEHRKKKFESEITRLQNDIQNELDNHRSILQQEKKSTVKKQKQLFHQQLEKSDEKLEQMMTHMLQLCTGLQSCADDEQQICLDNEQEKMEQVYEKFDLEGASFINKCQLEDISSIINSSSSTIMDSLEQIKDYEDLSNDLFFVRPHHVNQAEQEYRKEQKKRLELIENVNVTSKNKCSMDEDNISDSFCDRELENNDQYLSFENSPAPATNSPLCLQNIYQNRKKINEDMLDNDMIVPIVNILAQDSGYISSNFSTDSQLSLEKDFNCFNKNLDTDINLAINKNEIIDSSFSSNYNIEEIDSDTIIKTDVNEPGGFNGNKNFEQNLIKTDILTLTDLDSNQKLDDLANHPLVVTSNLNN